MVDMIFTLKKNRYTSHVHFCIEAWCGMFIARQETKQRGQQNVMRVLISLTYHKLVRNGVRGLFSAKERETFPSFTSSVSCFRVTFFFKKMAFEKQSYKSLYSIWKSLGCKGPSLLVYV